MANEALNALDSMNESIGIDKTDHHDSVPIWEKVTLTISEAAAYSNIGKNRIDSLLSSPRCSFVLYVGRKKLVKRKEFESFLAETIQL